jgi:carbon monoxide dehydrogenase subunit G
MELTNDFRVGVPVSDAWSVLTDVERIAPLLPGAQLQEIDGDEYRGVVKVKVGPITAQYKGTAVFVEQNAEDGRVVLRCNGRDTRGQGNANATITAVMRPDGDGTRVTVTTDLTVTGKVAQFGRGVLADISSKLIGQFVDALEADLRDHGTGPAPDEPGVPATEAPATDAPASDAPASESPAAEPAGVEPAPDDVAANGSAARQPSPVAAAASSTAAGAEPHQPAAGADVPTTEIAAAVPSPPLGARRVDHPDPEPVNLLDAAGGSVLKRMAPLVGVALIAVLAVAWRRRRARRGA